MSAKDPKQTINKKPPEGGLYENKHPQYLKTYRIGRYHRRSRDRL